MDVEAPPDLHGTGMMMPGALLTGHRIFAMPGGAVETARGERAAGGRPEGITLAAHKNVLWCFIFRRRVHDVNTRMCGNNLQLNLFRGY